MDNYLDLMRARRETDSGTFYAALDRAGRPATPRASLPCPRPLVSMRPLPPSRRGYRYFAENRPQELVRKLTGLAEHPELPEVRFDTIGNLQTNKDQCSAGFSRADSLGGFAASGAGDLEPCCPQD